MKEGNGIQILCENISNTGELAKALLTMPLDTGITPFGSPNCKLVYDSTNKVAYIDDNFDFLEEREV